MKTIINGREIKLFGKKEISVVLTEIVSDYLLNGFTFNYSDACRGSQGEELKIDLTNDNGKTNYRIWLTIDYFGLNGKRLILTVKKYNVNGRTFWFSDGETLYVKEFYSICNGKYGSSDNDIFVESKSDYEIIAKIQKERWKNSYDDSKVVYLSKSCQLVALKIIRKRKGYKNTRIDDIESIYHRISYGYGFRFVNKDEFQIKTIK